MTGRAVKAQGGQVAAVGPRLEHMASTREVAQHLQVPPHTLEVWRSQGKGPDYHKVGRHVRYEWSDVLQWLNARKMTTSKNS